MMYNPALEKKKKKWGIIRPWNIVLSHYTQKMWCPSVSVLLGLENVVIHVTYDISNSTA